MSVQSIYVKPVQSIYVKPVQSNTSCWVRGPLYLTQLNRKKKKKKKKNLKTRHTIPIHDSSQRLIAYSPADAIYARNKYETVRGGWGTVR